MAKSETQPLLAGDVQVTDDGVYIFPVDKDLTAADAQAVILYHEGGPRTDFRKAMKYYKGDQAIFDGGAKADFRPDNRLMINYAAYNIDTFNGFFAGIPPKITLDGDDAGNQALQDWHAADDFVDQFSELSKQADIYGRSYMQVYQDEDGETRTTVVSPERAFMIYDDTVARQPIAFVSYAYDASLKLTGVVYTKDAAYPFTDDVQMSKPAEPANVYGVVPAVEFVENEERLGVNHNVMSLLDGLNKAQSQKANQVEYFDNAYLVLFGIDLDDEDGNVSLNLDGNQILYSRDTDATKARAEFLQKPDGDTMQENHINRLIEQIHQVAMIPNMNDEAFSGNSSGVALEYKLLPMRNKAVTKARKFTPSLRRLYSILFSDMTNIGVQPDDWKRLKFSFSQNVPHNLADEATTAKDLQGIVSHETQLKIVSAVDDPQAEMKRLDDEQAKSATLGLGAIQQAAGALTDAQKAGVGDGKHV